MDNSSSLHIVMLPWLAWGHLLPFLELSKSLAQKGHYISFISTPNNIQNLPKIPSNLSLLINLVQLPLPPTENLPDNAESTIDLPSDDLRPFLKKAFTALQHKLSNFLHQTSQHRPVDWIVYDYAAYWVPTISVEFGIPCSYLSLFSAAVLGYQGSPQALLGNEHPRTTVEDYTVAPKWVPFPSSIAFRPYEVRQILQPATCLDPSGVTEVYRFAATIEGCDFLAIRSCTEFEPEWLQLIGDIFHKPIVPIGMLPPIIHETGSRRKGWESTFKWLDEQEPRSVVYAAFGSEVKLTGEQVEEIGLGLEQSKLPFLWALRADKMPEGLEERISRSRGLVCKGWVPQSELLAHPSVGGFLTHGGWNSVVEGLSFGVAMVVLPLIFDQGLNARNLVERGVAAEVARNEDDGSFTGKGIAESLRLVMVEEEGESCRVKARDYKEIIGNLDKQDKCLDDFVKYLRDHKKKVSTKTILCHAFRS